MLNILLLVAMCMVGIVIYCLGILQALICIFCGLPLTSVLGKQFPGKVDVRGLRRKYIFPIILWLVLCGGLSFAVFHWGNDYAKYGYLFGIGMPFLFSLGKWGMTEPNILDFLQGAQKYIAVDTFDRAVMLCLSLAR